MSQKNSYNSHKIPKKLKRKKNKENHNWKWEKSHKYIQKPDDSTPFNTELKNKNDREKGDLGNIPGYIWDDQKKKYYKGKHIFPSKSIHNSPSHSPIQYNPFTTSLFHSYYQREIGLNCKKKLYHLSIYQSLNFPIFSTSLDYSSLGTRIGADASLSVSCDNHNRLIVAYGGDGHLINNFNQCSRQILTLPRNLKNHNPLFSPIQRFESKISSINISHSPSKSYLIESLLGYHSSGVCHINLLNTESSYDSSSFLYNTTQIYSYALIDGSMWCSKPHPLFSIQHPLISMGCTNRCLVLDISNQHITSYSTNSDVFSIDWNQQTSNSYLYLGCRNGFINVYDTNRLPSNKPIYHLSHHDSVSWISSFSSYSYLLAQNIYGEISLYDLRKINNKSTSHIMIYPQSLNTNSKNIVFSCHSITNQELIFSIDYHNYLKVWDIYSGHLLKKQLMPKDVGLQSPLSITKDFLAIGSPSRILFYSL